jgi:hypothetical protein
VSAERPTDRRFLAASFDIGSVSWNPPAEQIGLFECSVASDGASGVAFQRSVQMAPVDLKKISRDVKYLTPSCCIDGVQSSAKKPSVSFAHPMMWRK